MDGGRGGYRRRGGIRYDSVGEGEGVEVGFGVAVAVCSACVASGTGEDGGLSSPHANALNAATETVRVRIAERNGRGYSSVSAATAG